MLDAMTADTGLKKRRSFLTNDPRRLPGVSMRSSHGRRFRDIVEALLVEFGPHADTARLRELASLKFTLEMTQSLVVGGDQAACDDLVRLSNLIARRESELRHRKAAAAPIDRRPLHERLADMRPVGGAAPVGAAAPLRERLASMRRDKALEEAKAFAGREIAAAHETKPGTPRNVATNVIHDDEEGDG